MNFALAGRKNNKTIAMLVIVAIVAGLFMFTVNASTTSVSTTNDASIYYLVTHWKGDLWSTIASGGAALVSLGTLVSRYPAVYNILVAASLGTMGYWAAAAAIVSTVGLGTVLTIFGSVAVLA